MIDEIKARYNAMYDKAASEVDTWCCPECGYEVQLSGAVHIEWGNPECHECDRDRGKTVLLKLGSIDPISKPQ